MNAADKYYLKAKELYSYEIDEAIEAMEYGLSCDDTHAGLITLQGEIYARKLKRFSAATECYELALYHEPQFVRTYYLYIEMLTEIDDIKAAETMIARALKVTGIDKPRIWHLEALLFEKQGMYTLALSSMNNATAHCNCKDCLEHFTDENKRIKKKSKKVAQDTGEVTI